MRKYPKSQRKDKLYRALRSLAEKAGNHLLGWVPVSVVAPSLLLSQVELQRSKETPVNPTRFFPRRISINDRYWRFDV